MKTVLFIAYYFPPMGGSGVQRSIKFVKYLQEFGIKPIVLSVDPRFTRWPKDNTMISEIPSNVNVYRTPTFDMNWLFKVFWGLKLGKIVNWLLLNILVPDAETTWLPFAKRKVDEITKEHKIDLVLITGGPFSSMLIGPYVLRKHALNYIVDFRDEWTNNHTRLDRPYKNKIRLMENQMEREVLDNCSGIVYAHPTGMEKAFLNKYPFMISKPSRIVTNGYDESDFIAMNSTTFDNRSYLKIVYIGSFYDRRRPLILWDALELLIANKEIPENKILVEIHGKNTPRFVLGDSSKSEIISKVVKFYPYCTHSQSLEIAQSATSLLIYLSPGVNSEPELPGKLFECLRSRKPLLALVPPNGDTAKIIRESRTGFVLDSDNLSEVIQGILQLYKLWEQDILDTNPDMQYISQFERRKTTEKLAGLINETISINT